VWDDSTATMSGTSMASPHVAGVAALVLSIKPTLTGAQVADILRQTARPLRDNAADPVPNNNYGFGCVDALAAVNRASPPISITRPIICSPTSPATCIDTTPIRCLSTQPITCSPVSRIVACPPTRSITCGTSSLIACPPITQAVVCAVTQPVRCPVVSARIACPSQICPNSLACGNPGLPGNPGLGAMGAGLGMEGDEADPYGGEFPEDGQ
jgi:Subtilase family